jgi:AcrR family transcriptional regulator
MATGGREAILRAAERLFAERGVGVSLREIGAAAGQRNNSAVQYHFGTREQLITALFEYRMLPMNRRRLELIAQLREAGRERELGALAGAYVRPPAEHIAGHPGTSWYQRFMVRLALSDVRPPIPSAAEFTEGISVLNDLIAAAVPGLPDGRLLAMNLHVIMGLANLEQRCDNPAFSAGQAASLTADLVSTTVAVLTAPPGGHPRLMTGPVLGS